MKILAIETSCDETAVAVLEIKQGYLKVISNVVASSVKLQAKYGGIVPEVAARKQVEYIIPVVEKATAEISLKSIDYIAVTVGPGLITSLRVGVQAAKALAYSLNKSLVAINHMEGHIYSALFTKQGINRKLSNQNKKDKKFWNIKGINFPALALLVSGGHTQLVLVKDYLAYKVIGETKDDAVGEAFDKVAKILNLGYPGGPIIAKRASQGNQQAIEMPRPMLNSQDYNFSFSGIKTSVLYRVKKQQNLLKNKIHINNMCASFEKACVDVLVAKTMRAVADFKIKTVLLGGGVAANKNLRDSLSKAIDKYHHQNNKKIELLLPEISLTGDNALMIALAAYWRIKNNKAKHFKKIDVKVNIEL